MKWLIDARGELTQADVAKRCGITQSMYSQIERNLKKPSVGTAKKIGAVLKINWTRFFEEVS